MGYQNSPGVVVKEFDFASTIPGTSVVDAGYVGQFKWGPLNQVDLIASEGELVARYGKPDNATFIHFFNAANYLSYSNKLRLVRVAAESSALNATSEATTGSNTSGTGVLIKNDNHYDLSYSAGQGNVGLWAAKFPGVLGNSLKVSFATAASYSQTLTSISSTGTTLTGTSFTTKLTAGSIIQNSGGVQRTIVSVTNATTAVLSSAFPVDLSSETVTAYWEYYNSFSAAPATSDFGLGKSAVNDEIHVIVVDKGGLFSGIKDTVLEKWQGLSLASDAKTFDGLSNYYANRINRTSAYVRWMDHLPAGTNWGSAALNVTFTAVALPATYTLAGGNDGAAISDSDLYRGLDLFKNAETVDIGLIICGAVSAAVFQYAYQNICEVRKDCIAFNSVPAASVINNAGSESSSCITYRDTLASSSYAVLTSNWKYQLDRYNDVYRWVPDSGDIAGLLARTEYDRDAWWSPAGLNRGILKNVVKLAWNPDKARRDDLFLNGINPVFIKPGVGAVLFGDKTLLSKPSPFDQIGIRRLFIVLEKSISKASEYTLFEFNDTFTRAQFKNAVEPFLRDIQSRRGIIDFLVVCDTSNNTGQVIDRYEFVADILIKPAHSIRYITLNFVATATGVSFNEVIGNF